MSVQISVKFKSHVRSDTMLRPLALQPSISEIIVKKNSVFFFQVNYGTTRAELADPLSCECCDMCVSASDIKCLFLYFLCFICMPSEVTLCVISSVFFPYSTLIFAL